MLRTYQLGTSQCPACENTLERLAQVVRERELLRQANMELLRDLKMERRKGWVLIGLNVAWVVGWAGRWMAGS